MASSCALMAASAAAESASAEAMVAFLGGDVGVGLGIFDPRHHLILLDAVPFLDVDFRQGAHGVSTQVDVILGLNLTRGGHHRIQILARHQAGLHRDQVPLAPALLPDDAARDRRNRKHT